MIKVDSLQDTLRLGGREILRRKWSLVLPFVGICALAVTLGFAWPTSYASSVTLYVEEKNIIDPLMKGRAVRAEVTGLVRNAREVIYKRSLMLDALDGTDRLENATAAEKENLIAEMRSRTTVSDPGENLIRIEYRDGDPQSVHDITQRMGQLFIERMLASKQQESEAAYEFIDSQVKRYDRELERIQAKLKEIRKEHPMAEPGALDELNRRQVELRGQIDNLEQTIREAEIREQSLREQLSGEADAGAAVTRAQQYRSRIAELRERLEELRLQYHESYPDIVEIKQQIENLQQRLRDAQSSEDSAEPGPGGAEPWQSNPVYQELQQKLYDVRTKLQTLRSRLDHVRQELQASRQKSSRLQDIQGRIDSLRRDYDVTRDMYEDLLRRRENARVSKDLDSEQKGLTIRVQEPAFVPHRPAGLQLLHFAVGGGFLAAAVPLSLLLLLLNLDSRVRHPDHFPAEAREVLLGTIARSISPGERRRAWLGLTLAAVVVLATLAALAGLAWLDLAGPLEDPGQLPWRQWLSTIGVNAGA